MNERQLQFRVGLFVLVAFAGMAGLILQFGEIRTWFEERYTLLIHFDEAPGVHPSTPVRRGGITIGSVESIEFDEEQGGVIVTVEILKEYTLRDDSRPRLVRSLLGDSTVEFVPGRSRTPMTPGTLLRGDPPDDPFEVVNRLETQVTRSLGTFNDTAREWQQVGHTLNALMDTNRGSLDAVIERTAESLHEFTVTMRSANKTFNAANEVLASPENQENLRRTLAELPGMVRETRDSIATIRLAVEKADASLENIRGVTEPLARKSTSIVTRLDNTLANLESFSGELNDFAQLTNREDGTLQKFASDPELYHNLNTSAASLNVLLKNLEPISRDLRIFSDRIARHPELMGVGGALKGSSGLKDPPEAGTYRQSNVPGRGLRN